MKDLKLNKEVANRLQDEEMANLVGAGPAISGSNTTSSTDGAKKELAMAMEEIENRSCCQKSCN